MLYELTIPPAGKRKSPRVLEIEAPNWLVALRRALQELGDPEIPRGKAMCEVRYDGTIVVDHPGDGRQFLIRTSRPKTQRSMPSVPPPVQAPASTLPYIEAAIQEEVLRVDDSAPRAPRSLENEPVLDACKVPTGGHPCVVLDRSEVLRRFEAARKQAGQDARKWAGTDTADDLGNDGVPDYARPVKNMPVVEIDPETNRALSALQVDLDSLRHQAMLRTPAASSRGAVLEAFNWILAPLQAALDHSSSSADMAERVMRLALAALPSRTGIVALWDPSGTQRVHVGVGEFGALLTGRTLNHPEGIFNRVVHEGVSMVLGGGGREPLDIRRFYHDIGFVPNDALMVCICHGRVPHGTLALINSLSGQGYTADHLILVQAMAERLAGPLGRVLSIEGRAP